MPDKTKKDLVQSVVFKRPEWSKSEAIEWLKHNGYYHDSIDTKPHQLRFRQLNPEDLTDYHYITKPLKNDVSLIIAIKSN